MKLPHLIFFQKGKTLTFKQVGATEAKTYGWFIVQVPLQIAKLITNFKGVNLLPQIDVLYHKIEEICFKSPKQWFALKYISIIVRVTGFTPLQGFTPFEIGEWEWSTHFLEWFLEWEWILRIPVSTPPLLFFWIWKIAPLNWVLKPKYICSDSIQPFQEWFSQVCAYWVYTFNYVPT